MRESEIEVGGTYRCVISRNGAESTRTVLAIDGTRLRYKSKGQGDSRWCPEDLYDFARRAQERIA